MTAGLLRRSSIGDTASSQCPPYVAGFGGSWLVYWSSGANKGSMQGKVVSSFALLVVLGAACVLPVKSFKTFP